MPRRLSGVRADALFGGMYRVKMLVVFSKTGALKYIGHLDLMRAMQRALRRSGLPVKYSQGYNPHIVLGFAAPLSVGFEGLREVMEVPLAGDVEPDAFLEAISAALPPLLRCVSARVVPDTHPAPMASLAAAAYVITPLADAQALQNALAGFLAQQTIPAQRRSKKGMVSIDLRPLIYNMLPRGTGFEAVLALAESGTCKPDLLIQSFAAFAGIEAPPCDVVRKSLLSAKFIPLEDT